MRARLSSASSRLATTSRASSTVEMKGITRRSKRVSGNWISRALPIVSALMPVLSERKKTGTTSSSRSSRPSGPDVVVLTSTSSPAAHPADQAGRDRERRERRDLDAPNRSASAAVPPCGRA